MQPQVEERIRALPDRPGIYVFRDVAGEALYVGKAKSLRKRAIHYIGPQADTRLQAMVEEAAELEFVAADTEAEALLLENQWIKHAKPRYNIRLRDDKTYPYLKLTVAEEWPRLVFTRRVIGWAMHQILDAQLVIAALQMALTQRRPGLSLIIHSDRGAQFASAAYRQVLTQHRLLPSMSRKGNCYDNAFIESFWSTLKYELVYHHRFATLAAARTAIFDYIETFYNRTRLHSSLDYQSPINFESKLN